MFPVRLATCNLHGENTRAGITGLIEHISLKQYISTAPIRHDTSQPEVWIESGGVSLGPIKAEAAMALPNLDFHEIQNEFLLTHDARSMRLWFLWPVDIIKIPTAVIGKCGCIGGCTFFGKNKNGIGFFHPKTVHEATPNAVCKVTPEGNDPGFGQSLLHKNKLVFDIGTAAGWGTPSKEFTFTRGYMSNLTTPDSPGTSITVIEEYATQQNTLKPGNTTEVPFSCHQRSLTRSPTIETQSTSSFTGETAPDNVSINPFDTVKSTESSVLRDGDRSMHEDQGSKPARSISQSSSSSPPPFSPMMRSSIAHSPSSRSSVHSPSGHSSLRSASPTSLRLRYGSRYDPNRQTSIVSLDSEMYFSAEEDALSSSDPNFSSLKQPSFPDMVSSEGESVTWVPEENSPRLNTSDVTQIDETVIERKDSYTSTNSTLSYMSADTDPDENMSGGIPSEFSMVDLHSQACATKL